ncbi:hypothetical protein hrd7_25250 [Leptolinea sp. HRD-7]|nr:hypothetical protein hrd7_25250 [Leptolinea sp. HRD-7]
MKEPMGKIVLAQDVYGDDERIQSIAEKAWIRQQYFDKINKGSTGRPKACWTENMVMRRYKLKSGKPDGLKPIKLNNGLVMDMDIYWGRRRYLAGFSSELQLLGYIEVTYSED